MLYLCNRETRAEMVEEKMMKKERDGDRYGIAKPVRARLKTRLCAGVA